MTFERTDNHKKALEHTWRKPKGLQNKMRLGRRGQPKTVKPGYRTPKDERHKKDGLDITRIQNAQDLEEADPDQHAINIDNMGRRKKVKLIKEAKDRGFTFVNLQEDQYVEKTEKILEERKQKREEIKQKKEEQKEKEEETEDEAEDEEKVDPEEQQEKDREAAEEAITKSK